MHFAQLFVAFCFSSLVVGHGHKQTGAATSGNQKANGTAHAKSEKSQCNEISRLTQLTEFASNATKLTELETKHNLTATQLNEIKAEAANATTRLTELKANTTLVSQCAAVAADKQLKSQCKEIETLTKLTAFVNNATALSELQAKRNLTAAQMEEIKEEAANATAKLQTLTSNTTLTASCQTQQASGKKNTTGQSLCVSILKVDY
jgi:hypothetical protein